MAGVKPFALNFARRAPQAVASVNFAAIATLLGDRERAVQLLASVADDLTYRYFHRDGDFDRLWDYALFVARAKAR